MWKITTEKLPKIGQKVWYHYVWIGTWEGVYIGIKKDDFNGEEYPCFEGDCFWQADCPTYWTGWKEEKPLPPKESLELYESLKK